MHKGGGHFFLLYESTVQLAQCVFYYRSYTAQCNKRKVFGKSCKAHSNKCNALLILCKFYYVGSVFEFLKRRAYDQHGLGSKSTRAILLCFRKRHFTTIFPVW